MNDKRTITILTPTFNRSQTLFALYQSLADQTCNDFEWLVVDDGSTDATGMLIEQWQREADFPIYYVYKENGGKHTALNMGIETIETDLTFIVDSDDQLTFDAVETIMHYHHRYCEDDRLCGYVFLRKFPDGKINGKIFKTNEKISNYIEARINADDTMADKAEVFFTRCLKEFPFPEYIGEKFLGEDIVWICMARKYDMLYINKAIYVSNYLEDGLTNSRRMHNIESPVGCMHRAEEFLKQDIKLKYRIKGALQYIIYGKFAGYSMNKLIRKNNYKILILLCAPFGILIYQIWKRNLF